MAERDKVAVFKRIFAGSNPATCGFAFRTGRRPKEKRPQMPSTTTDQRVLHKTKTHKQNNDKLPYQPNVKLIITLLI